MQHEMQHEMQHGEKWALKKPVNTGFFMMPLAGLEPARYYPLDFESSASANSATAAHKR